MEKVGIEVELMGAEEAHRLLQTLDKDIDRLNKRKSFRSLSGLNKSKAELEGYIKELERLNKLRQTKVDSGLSTKSTDKAIADTTAKIKAMSKAYDEVNSKQRTFMQTAKAMTSHVAHIGSAMQSLGNAMTRLTSPFNRLTTGLLYGAGYKALNLFTEGLSGTFERADTMKLYPKMLKEFGFSAKESQKAISELEESVLGLPTGLDEIVAVQKRFVAASQDMEKSTGLAIAYNNAILASGSDARQQWTAQRILTQLAGGAEIAATSWDALQRAIPLVFTELSKDAKMGVSDYVSALKTGQISTEDFMKAFTKIGGEGGTIANAARTMTKSWQGLTANIQNATKRMGTAILDSLHEAFKEETGRDLLDTLLGIDAEGNRTYDGVRDWIDGISKSIQDWIKANPDKIIDFFNELKSIDIKGLLKGMAEGMKLYVSALKLLVKLTGGKGLQGLGKWLVYLNLFGKGLTIFGGVLKGLRHPLGWIGAGALKLGGKLGKIGIFGKIASIFGKKKAIEEAGDAAKSVPTVAQSFRKAFSALEGLIKAAGAVLIVGTTGMIAFKEVKEMLKDIKDIGEILDEMTWLDAVNGVNIALGITALTKGFEALGKALGPEGALNIAIAGLAAVLIGGTFTALMWEIQVGLDQFKTAIGHFKDVATELSTFEAPNINIDGILKTIGQIDEVYRALSGEGKQTKAGRFFRGAGFLISPVAPLLSGLGKGANQAMDAKGVASKYSSMLNAIKNLKKIANEINSLASVTINEGAVGSVEAIIDAVSTIKQKMSILTGRTKSSKNLVANTSNLAKAFSQMQKMANKINALAGTSVNKAGFGTFVTNLKDAVSELDALDQVLELDISVKLAPAFAESVSKTIQAINKAKKNISDTAKKGITATIPVRITFSVTTNFLSALATIISQRRRLRNAGGGSTTDQSGSTDGRYHGHGRSMGGEVYRAKGGGIGFPGRPRGTDTVPTWLTPGEYVHNKQAVNAFGIDFMRKVNNLDVRGAMAELMHRAGGMANVNRGTVVNNTYNNNQKVVQNINTNSADFAFRSASRFVGAF